VRGAFLALSSLEYSLKIGLSPFTVGTFASFAVIQIGLCKFQAARRFGELAFSLLDRIPCQEVAALTVAMVSSNIAYWREPYENLYERLDGVMSNSLASGDVHPGTIAVLWIRFQAGENLAVLEQRFATFESRLRELNQDTGIEWLKPAWLTSVFATFNRRMGEQGGN
jgi:hypothetical protein